MSSPPVTWWPQPNDGDIVWCHFPFMAIGGHGPKPRPALVLSVAVAGLGHEVLVVPGTSQRVTALVAGEFAIARAINPAAYVHAGLSYDTKFCFTATRWLPYNSLWFDVPPGAPYGQNPQLGLLHPLLHHAAHAAWVAAGSPS